MAPPISNGFQKIFNAKKLDRTDYSCLFEAEILEFQRLNRAGQDQNDPWFQVYVRYLKRLRICRSFVAAVAFV